MNRLKCVFGIQVPHPVSEGLCQKHHSTRLFWSATKEVADLNNTEQLKNGTPCACRSKWRTNSTVPKKYLERNSSTKCAHKRRSHTYPFTKSPVTKRFVKKYNETDAEFVSHANDSKFHDANDKTLSEELPRSYAQIIANYSEKMYTQSALGFLNEGTNFTVINDIPRSPFSTTSLTSLKWKGKDKATKKPSHHAAGMLQQNAKFSSGVSMNRYDCLKDNRAIFPAFTNNEFETISSSSYASMIEKYSNAMTASIGVYSRMNGTMTKRNSSTNFDDVSITLFNAKDVGNKSSHVAAVKTEESGAKNLSATGRNNADTEDRIGWITKVEDIIKDLKQVVAKKEADGIPTTDKWVLQSVNERAHWLDRVVTAHKKMIEDKKLITSKALENEKVNQSIETAKFDSEGFSLKVSDDKKFAQNESGSQNSRSKGAGLQSPQHVTESTSPESLMTATGGKPSNPISQYINRIPPNQNTPPKSTSQTPPTNVSSSPPKEPQIELRMTPSQNESVVSINVDELAAKTAGAKDHLSVVISSNRDRVGKTDAYNQNLSTDFGSMQISISEDTVPVKQIEFSINGKPVSELKSIVARADKLDVVSSRDKVEIRIPSSKEKTYSQQQPLNKTNSTSVLNLQIAAKFNEPRVQQPKDTRLKPETAATPSALPPIPPKPRSTFTPKLAKSEVGNPSVTNTRIPESITGKKQINPSTIDARDPVAKQETMVNVAESDPAVAKADTATLQQVSSNRNTTTIEPTPQPSMNIDTSDTNQTREERTPSNTIPWWSSEESFKKIKKKDNNSKGAMAAENTATEQNEESDIVAQKTGQELTPGSIYEQQQQHGSPEFSNTVAGKEAAKKPILDEKEKISDLSESAFRAVRVRSLPRRAAAKPMTTVKARKHVKKGSPASGVKVGKKLKYRIKSNVVKSTVVKEPQEPSVSVTHLPKAVEYVSVNPQRFSVEKKPKATEPASLNAKADVNKQQSTASIAKTPKVETKPNTNVKKFAAPQGSTPKLVKPNVQHKKSISKETNLEKSANRSAGVSVKSSLEHKQGKEQGEAGRTAEKNLQKRCRAVDHAEDQRLKKILKSMKPIEKKKDGTLIDYGVTVPSRKPAAKLKQTTEIRSNAPIRIDANEVVTVSTTKLKDESVVTKVDEPQSVSSTNKERFMEPRSVVTRVKIVETEKIKKETSTESKNLVAREKVVDAENVSSVKKETLTEPKSIPLEKIVDAGTVSSTKKPIDVKDSEANTKKPIATVQYEKYKSHLTESQKMQAINLQKHRESTSKIPKPVKTNSGRTNSATSRPLPPTKVTRKSVSEISIMTNAPKNSHLERLKGYPLEGTIKSSKLQLPEKQGSQKAPKLLEKPGKMPLEGTIVTIPQTTKTDNGLLKQSSTQLKNKLSNSKILPLKNTNYHSKDQKSLSSFTETSKNKTPSETTKKKDPKDGVNTKPPSSTGRGEMGSSNSPGELTGPAGLNSQKSPMMTEVQSNFEANMPIEYSSIESHGTMNENQKNSGSEFINNESVNGYILSSNNVVRSEKDILYSSWLQRFKGKYDNDNLV